MMPSIGIDYTAAVHQQAGIGRSVREVTTALIDAHSAKWCLFVAGGKNATIPTLPPPAELHTSPLSQRNHERLWYRLRLPLPIEWWTGQLDIFHAMDFALPPTQPATRTVVTIHDVAYEHYPEQTMPGMLKHLQRVVPRSARAADHVVVPSDATKRDVVAFYSVPETKVTVIPHGVERRFNPKGPHDAPYPLPDQPFVLTVGTLQPRKNHRRLVQAMALVEGVPLVIAGGAGWAYDEVQAEVQRLGLADRVHFIGYVDDNHLPALYRAAGCLAYPALYEGFGLPVLEAMACGLPVVASNTSSLPEVAGEAGVLVDPLDVEGIAAGIRTALDNADLAAAGLKQAAQFTWQRAAEAHWQVYQSLIGSQM